MSESVRAVCLFVCLFVCLLLNWAFCIESICSWMVGCQANDGMKRIWKEEVVA
jgi:hypothetical protein